MAALRLLLRRWFAAGGDRGAATGRWRLRGLDAFSGEPYALPGVYATEDTARRAAQKRLRALEKTQPTATSGGQNEGGLQDRVYIIAPDGREHRYLPERNASAGR